MPNSPMMVALLVFCLAGIFFALVKGGPAERLGAGVILANLLLSYLKDVLVSADLQPVAQLGIDGATALFLLFLVLRFASLWLGAVMILYAVQFGLHAFYLVTDRPPHDMLHAVVNNLTFLAVIWSLIIGTAFTWRRRIRAIRTPQPAAS